jgi:hypothetical protein
MKTSIKVLALAAEVIKDAGAVYDTATAAGMLAQRLDWTVLSDPASMSFIARLLIREASRRERGPNGRARENIERTGDDVERYIQARVTGTAPLRACR